MPAEVSGAAAGEGEESEEESLFMDLPAHTFKKGDPIVFRHARRDGTVPDMQAILLLSEVITASDSLKVAPACL